MASSYQLLLGGQPADPDLYTLIVSIEVEESMDMPAAVQILVPVARSSGGDLAYVSDPARVPSEAFEFPHGPSDEMLVDAFGQEVQR